MDITKKLERLEGLPEAIRKRELESLNARKELENAKADLEIAMSFKMLESDRPNATEKKAYAITETEEFKRKVIDAQHNFDKKQAHFNALVNDFIAIRKLMSFEEKMVTPNNTGN